MFSLKYSKNDPIKHLWWLVSKTPMDQTSENIFLLSLRQDHFSNLSRKLLGSTLLFFYLKNSDIFTHIEQKGPCQTPVMAGFRHTHAPTSRKYLSTELKTRWFQFVNQNIFIAHSPVFIFKRLIFSLKLSKDNPVRKLWWLVSEIRIHRLPEYIFPLSLRQDRFSKLTRKFLGLFPPVLYLKNWHFHSNSGKTTMSDTCGAWFQKHRCNDSQKICFYRL